MRPLWTADPPSLPQLPEAHREVFQGDSEGDSPGKKGIKHLFSIYCVRTQKEKGITLPQLPHLLLSSLSPSYFGDFGYNLPELLRRAQRSMAHGQKSPRWALTQGSCSLALSLSVFSLLLLLLLTASAADEYDYYSWQADNFHSGRFYTKQPQCVDIPADMRLCHNVGYKKMRLPNLLDHESMPEVKQQAGSWVPLLAKRCHPDTQVFLCSLFAPVCLDRPIYPCRSLCEAVRDSCAPVMETYGFPWPEMLTCDKFPIDNDLCIPMQYTGNHATQPPGRELCTQYTQITTR